MAQTVIRIPTPSEPARDHEQPSAKAEPATRSAFPASDVPMRLSPEQIEMVRRAVARNRAVYDSLADR